MNSHLLPRVLMNLTPEPSAAPPTRVEVPPPGQAQKTLGHQPSLPLPCPQGLPLRPGTGQVSGWSGFNNPLIQGSPRAVRYNLCLTSFKTLENRTRPALKQAAVPATVLPKFSQHLPSGLSGLRISLLSRQGGHSSIVVRLGRSRSSFRPCHRDCARQAFGSYLLALVCLKAA